MTVGSSEAFVRDASVKDAGACAAIYAPYVTDTAITFETVAPSAEEMAERGYRVAIAGMTLPNEASVGLHRALGFEPVGTYRRIGFKHGAWHDVAWTQLMLSDGRDPPAEPT